MNITWEITEAELHRLNGILVKNQNVFVESRINRNVKKQGLNTDRDAILKAICMCLLTSQQRSGPNSPVAIFLRKNPFPFTYQAFITSRDRKQFIQSTLRENNLNRFIEKVSTFLNNIFFKLENDNWKQIDEIITNLKDGVDKKLEREKADQVHTLLSGNGFGPKQSRNFLQALGLTKYEIPIDSRITSWLNKFGFPVFLSSNALQDKGYYHFVSDGIQTLCERAEIYPCVLDAAIFSSSDDNQWTAENIVY